MYLKPSGVGIISEVWMLTHHVSAMWTRMVENFVVIKCAQHNTMATVKGEIYRKLSRICTSAYTPNSSWWNYFNTKGCYIRLEWPQTEIRFHGALLWISQSPEHLQTTEWINKTGNIFRNYMRSIHNLYMSQNIQNSQYRTWDFFYISSIVLSRPGSGVESMFSLSTKSLPYTYFFYINLTKSVVILGIFKIWITRLFRNCYCIIYN